MKRLSALLAALVLLFSAGVAAAEEEDDVLYYNLPIDFSPGNPINSKYFLSDTVYEDPTIRVEITSGDYNGVLYWIADVEIMDPSQLRTAAAESFASKRATELGSVMAQRMNAVLAVDGDYFNYSRNKDVRVTIRQGITYKNSLLPGPCQDVLLIDEDGDFHGIEDPRNGDIGTEINGKKIINAFYFGPLLVNNGEKRVKDPSHMDPMQLSQRVAICQTGHLKYRVIVTSSSRYGSKAFRFDPWRDFVASMDDVQVAYNLDGGDSAFLYFNDKKINNPEFENERKISDIIYFASVWPGV